MSALANLAKYTGRYDEWLQLRHRYNLKWSKTESLQHFYRFFNDDLSFETMLQAIKQMIAKTPTWTGLIIKFGCCVGLRPAEVVESVKLLNVKNLQTQEISYYNPERQTLEHFRFPVFQRATKKAYISIVNPEILELVQNLDNVPKSYNDIRLACYTSRIKCDLRFARKIFASWLHKCGISSVIIDLLQGRVPKSVLVQHYLVPVGTDYKDKVLQAISELRRKIEET
jgi:intergrase/recombinase